MKLLYLSGRFRDSSSGFAVVVIRSYFAFTVFLLYIFYSVKRRRQYFVRGVIKILSIDNRELIHVID